jgi:hypothetical protein
MGDLAALLDWPGTATWGVFAFASGGTALIEASRHAIRAWHQWRLDRRLARNPYILREELNEYRFRIDDDLPPLDPARLVGSSVLVGVLAAIPAWLAERHLEHWWQYACFAFFLFGLLSSFWRRLNDPPEMHPGAALPGVTVPREAWLGLAGGIAIVALILVFVAALV